jgi:arylsulfatase A
MGKWKGIKQKLKKNPNAALKLYNLEEDIGEKRNVVEKHPDIAQQMESIMLEQRTMPSIEKFRFGRY